jgi:Uma2 family endonuclease
MNIAFPTRLTVDEFLAWAVRQKEGKYELVDGVVIVQQAQRWGHSKVKAAVYEVLRDAIEAAGASYYVAPDGPTVRISRHKAFVPDALVAPLPEPEFDDLEIDNPIVVVEVLSPSTVRMDTQTKLRGYFKVASVQHYLIVDPGKRIVTCYTRSKRGPARRRIVRKGALALNPPGIEIHLRDVFGGDEH